MAFVRTRPPRFGVRDRGLGDAQCPSVEQLEGIVDLSDPCQQSISAAGDTVVPPLTATQAAAAGVTTTGAIASPFASTIFGVPVPYAVLGGVVLALVFVSSSGGRRR